MSVHSAVTCSCCRINILTHGEAIAQWVYLDHEGERVESPICDLCAGELVEQLRDYAMRSFTPSVVPDTLEEMVMGEKR
jgi:hypothetical protein